MEEKVLDIIVRLTGYEELRDNRDVNLVEDYILDSLAFIELISELEDEFNIEIQPTQVPNNTWNSIDNIVKMVETEIKKQKTKDKNMPNPNKIYPIKGYDKEIYVKPTIKNKNIIVGDFTYIADSEFENHVTHHYDFNGDKLIIGKFCQIASGVEFVMNGANHQMNCVTTFPFYTLEGWNQLPPKQKDLPIKGDTVIGNDVWIGQNATILPGVHVGDGVIIGANSVVGSDVEPYTIVVGNPAKPVRKRFDDELIEIMEKLKWWDRSAEEINNLIPILTSSDLKKVKEKLFKLI